MFIKKKNEEKELTQQKIKHVEREHCNTVLWIAKPRDETKVNENDYHIHVPESMIKQLTEWCHSNLFHPGSNRTYCTMKEDFSGKKLKMR